MLDLSGKVIVVTGASSGIGRSCAIRCAQQNARVVLLGRSEERLLETWEQMENRDQHRYYIVDLLDEARVDAVKTDIITHFGPIAGMVHAAGISTTLPFKMATKEKWQLFFETNVHSALHLTQIFLKRGSFQETGGAVVFLTSVMASVGESGKTLYSMTKGALLAVARSLAIEYASRNIRFNCISPGVVVTPMSAAQNYAKDELALKQMTERHPLGLGQPDDIAHAVVFLLADEARWMTGSNLVIDGGYSAR